MIEFSLVLDVIAEVLFVLAGIWCVKAKLGKGAYAFLIGACINISMLMSHLYRQEGIDWMALVGNSLGWAQAIVIGLPAVGKLLIAIGSVCMAYKVKPRKVAGL